ncbi:COP9 signalosome complex subunit 1-like [Schistocerca gregaria]|uniref:COP9 signalosome complex subunit 1-like n=1 Tax=Schistocerca gregaria TaxID=7010 RepID=UPI00211E7F12|nr:COP9 signalosome complex subunit 1-like [Schistocerca gregaria]
MNVDGHPLSSEIYLTGFSHNHSPLDSPACSSDLSSLLEHTLAFSFPHEEIYKNLLLVPSLCDENDVFPSVKPSKNFDFNVYIQSYIGYTQIERLLLIGETCPSLRDPTRRFTLQLLQQSENVFLYKKLMDRPLFSDMEFDGNWILEKEKEACLIIGNLENENSIYKSKMDKKKVYEIQCKLGQAHYKYGNFTDALQAFSNARESCSTPQELFEVNLECAFISIQLQNFDYVSNSIGYLAQSQCLEPNIASKLKSWAALAMLYYKNYRLAVVKFLEIPTSHYNAQIFSDVLSVQDLITYICVLSLAESDRREISDLLGNANFRSQLESLPHIHALLTSFYNLQYNSFIQLLDQISNDLRFDLYMHRHIHTLSKKIYSKALLQYLSPYECADLRTMGQSFGVDPAYLEKQIAWLINDGALMARIDSCNKLIYTHKSNERMKTYSTTLKTGDGFRRNTVSTLVRISLTHYNSCPK